jgi:hypothetical protein
VPPELIDKWKRDVQGLQVRVYPEGGHIPMEEFPDETSRDADAFLSSGDGAALADSSGGDAWGAAAAQSPKVEAREPSSAAPAEAPAAPQPKKKPSGKSASGMADWGDVSN